jgi:hypothetical protein
MKWTPIDPVITSFETTRATELEIPVIVSYHFGQGRVRGYAGGGLVPYEKAWGRIDARSILHNQGDRQTNVVFSFSGLSSNSTPLILSAGMDYLKGRWVFRPEFRYTHSNGSSGSAVNQFDIFLGISFRAFPRTGGKKIS